MLAGIALANHSFCPRRNATKIVGDATGTTIASVAGEATIGPITIMDYVRSTTMPITKSVMEQEQAVAAFASEIGKLRAAAYQQYSVPENLWRDAAVVLAVAHPSSSEPLLWQVSFIQQEAPEVTRILGTPGVWFSGIFPHPFSLLYGYLLDVLQGVGDALTAS